jgi:predicted transcriptional regulator
MSMGIVSDDDFQKELSQIGSVPSDPIRTIPSVPDISPSVNQSSVVSQLIPKGRKEGDVNVPDSLRKIIGETAVIEGRSAALNIAKDFGISPSSVSAYAKGATSTTSYNSPSKEIISHINKSRARAVGRASKVLNTALGSITQDKLDYTDAKDLSAIAKDMSVIIKNLEPPTPANTRDDTASNGVQFVIFAPQFRREESFDVINVTE